MRDYGPKGFPSTSMTERICQMLKEQIKGGDKSSLWSRRAYYDPAYARQMRRLKVKKEGYKDKITGSLDDRMVIAETAIFSSITGTMMERYIFQDDKFVHNTITLEGK